MNATAIPKDVRWTAATWIIFGCLCIAHFFVNRSSFVPFPRTAHIAQGVAIACGTLDFFFFIGIGSWSALGYRVVNRTVVPQTVPIWIRAALAILIGPGTYIVACGALGNTMPNMYTYLFGEPTTAIFTARGHSELWIRNRGFVCYFPVIEGIPNDMIGKGRLCGPAFEHANAESKITTTGKGTSLGLRVADFQLMSP